MYQLVHHTLSNIQDRYILSYYGRRYTNDEVLDRIDRLAYYLHTQGIGKGDVVAICLPNIPNAIIAVYAVNKCGAIANLIHPLTPALGLRKICQDTHSKLLIYLDSFYYKSRNELSFIKTILCNVSDDMGMPMRLLANLKTYKTRRNSLKDSNTIDIRDCYDDIGEVIVPMEKEDIAIYLHSGGTTGVPKTIMISNRAMNALADKAGALVGDFHGNTDAILMVLPLFHGFGLGIAMHTAIYKGAKVVLQPRFSADETAKLIKKEGITFMAGVPQMYSKLMDSKKFNGECIRKLKNVYCGGDKLPKSIKDRWDTLMRENGNDIEILEGYGLTEVVTVSHVNVPRASKASSVGKPLKGMEHKIVDEDGNRLPPNVSGEICLSGDTMMSGYLGDAANKAIRKEEDGIWLYTGDCGYIDEDGFLFFRERIKRMTKISGINVFPQEIEYLVSSLKEVKSACALEMRYKGKPAIKLYIVLSKGYQLDMALEQRIKSYIADRLMKYSVPKMIVQRESLPLTMVGKVDYMKLYQEEKGNLIYD